MPCPLLTPNNTPALPTTYTQVPIPMARLLFLPVVAALLLLATGAAAAVAYTQEALDDEVVSLPGLNYKPSFRHFSGYLNVAGEGEPARMMHYQFFESENNASTDPVVLWSNGGPGCSGLLGLYTGVCVQCLGNWIYSIAAVRKSHR